MTDSDRSNRPGEMQAKETRRRSAELHNDRTHDSTVDTDGKNREAARLAGDGLIGPDEVTTSNASLDNSVPEALDGLAGFDSRGLAHRMPFAPETGFEAVDMGMSAPELPYDFDWQLADPREPGQRRSPGRIHYAINHMRPTRVVELHRKP
ncbi:DUF3005 domain-containing protein [Paraburkholderia pallida]|uniref:DUF3005 domain-containing protein n=1 Tax=Paraburkholderia pallida TaxID=2547399 RepID=A0A4V1AZJ0_9BURK|nr:DUF3005 domain-containing protein [Paraburkholderia pallida]QBQ99442.1 DUF3005 domain-containing protein [Paraburkholderia pallida]